MSFEITSGPEDTRFRSEFDEADFRREGFHTKSHTLDLPIGRVKSSEWLFDGIRVLHSEAELHRPAELDWRGDTEMINMHFNLQGRISLQPVGLPDAFELKANQHNIFYGREAEGKMKMDELQMRLFLVQLSKDSFFTIVKDGNDALKRFADHVEAGKPVAFSENNLEIDLALQSCMQAMLNCRYADPLKRMFFYSKAIELLVLQAESFNRHMFKKPTVLKTEYDRERILFARDYLMRNIDCPPTLTELARIAGINEFKLKRGFKEIFNQTVFEYLSNVRLEIAKSDLLERRKSATEIAFELGYSSLQHFSNAFKKKFGVSPKQV